MKPIDTHAHLQFKGYDEDRDFVIKRNSEELEAIINVGTSVDSSEKGIGLSEKIENFYASIGVHPHHVDQWAIDSYKQLKALGENKKVVAVGEIGLDNHFYKDYPEPNLKSQSKILHEQIDLAISLNKPILFHCRDAYDQLYAEIKQYGGKIDGLMHCYMGSADQAKKFLAMGLYISFAGNLTYKGNDYMRQLAKNLPEDKILTETDSPFLTPEPHRGKRNEPSYVKIIATTIADLRNWSLEKTILITAQNAKSLFRIQL